MRRRGALLLALGGASILVIGALLWPRPAPKTAKPAAPAIPILRIDEKRIRRMELVSVKGRVALAAGEKGWKAEYPHPIRLWDASINNLLFAFTRLDAERLVAEEPGALEEFGLAPPAVRASATLDDGSVRTLLLGGQSASGAGCYLMVEGERRLYTVSKTMASYLGYRLDDLRLRTIGSLDLQTIAYLLLRRGETVLEVREKKGEELARFSLTYGNYLMSRPYKRLRGLSSERFPGLLLQLDGIRIEEFVDDAPRGLAAYGLDAPWAELRASDPKSSLHLLFGARNGAGLVYFKEAGSPAVYAIAEARTDFLRDLRPFDFVDKYVYMPEMRDLSRVEIRQPGRTRVMALERGEGPSRYLLDGQEVEAEAFKAAFLGIAGLYAEGEIRELPRTEPELTLRFVLESGASVAAEYRPYDRSFYAVVVDGIGEFAISREQVAGMLKAVESLAP